MIKLPSVFSNGMVISKEALVWGWGEPGENVKIKFLGKNYEIVCNDFGWFETTIYANRFGGPHQLMIGNLTIEDVYVGRVWLCGGQSNMETQLGRTRPLLEKHILGDGRIRFFQVEKGLEFNAPKEDVVGKWQVATEENLEEMYAVPYFFARNLLESDGVGPIGLVCCPAGGTSIQGWLPEEIVKDYPGLYKELLTVKGTDYVEKSTIETEKSIALWNAELRKKDTGLQENRHLCKYDDSAWEDRMLFDFADLPQHGSVWYRKTVKLTAEVITTLKHNPPSRAILSLGRAQNSVSVYINGNLVHTVEYMYPPCHCEIPAELLKLGDNHIAVQVVGSTHPPRFIPDKDYSFTCKDVKINLDGLWKRRIGAEMPRCVDGVWFYNHPCGVYNYMLAPLLGYTADGLIWYQGESNTGNPSTYKELFGRFAKHVRKHFGEDLCIIFTQLANFVDPNGNGEGWARLRDEQRKCLEIPNTAMAVAIDCGEWNDLHPIDKKTVGDRLAQCARNLVYNQKVAYQGPVAKAAVFNDGLLKISFEQAGGLWAKNGRPLLEMVDEEGKICRVYAALDEYTLTAKFNDFAPTVVRFGFTDNPSVVLYNMFGLPASPFEIAVTSA